MLNSLAVFFILALISAAVGQTFSNFSKTLKLNVSTDAPCSTCCPGFLKRDHFVMITSGGIGEFVVGFDDFLPPGFLLSKVTVDLLGSFELSGGSQLTTMSVELNDIAIFTDYPIPPPAHCPNATCCKCVNCHRTVSPPSQNSSGWWNYYTYGGRNTLEIILTSNSIALSEITITLIGADVNPEVDELSPEYLPVQNSTGPLVIMGDNFLFSFLYTCVWQDAAGTNHSQEAIRTDEYVLECSLPSEIMAPGPALFWVIVNISVGNAEASAGPFDYYFYQEPVIQNLIPSNGPPAGGEEILVYGEYFFNSSVLFCRFGLDQLSPAVWINASSISCQVPAMTTNTEVDVAVTENDGYDWTNCKTFTYSNTPPPNPPFHFNFMYIMIAAAFCFLFVMALMGGYVVYKFHSREERRYSPLDPNDIDTTAGTTIEYDELTFKEKIGGGSFGVVYRGYWRYTEIAIKQITISNGVSLQELVSEAKLMANLRHPNITQLMGMCVHLPDVCIVTEFISRGSLFALLHLPEGRIVFEPEHIRKFALDTCKGMAYIHGAKIMHRDLKCSNLLVTKDWNIKVSDFGLSRFVTDVGNTMTACGTPSWAAPEVLRNNNYSFKADVYSFGVSLWEMITQKYPYDGQPPYHVVISVATKGIRPELNSSIPPEFAKMMTTCWDEDPEVRPSFGDLVIELEELKFQQNKIPKFRRQKKSQPLSFDSELPPTPKTSSPTLNSFLSQNTLPKSTSQKFSPNIISSQLAISPSIQSPRSPQITIDLIDD